MTCKTQIGKGGAISYRERATAKRRTYLDAGVKKFNVKRMLRVFFTVLGIGILSWYGKSGVPPFGARNMVRIDGLHGSHGEYTVSCIAAKFGNDTSVISTFKVTGALPANDSELPSPDSSGAANWKVVRPFADSTTAVLLTFEKVSVLICDSSIFIPPPAGASTLFREKLELMILPPADERTVLDVRDRFRPRLLAVHPPCSAPSGQNIICKTGPAGTHFRYDFKVKGQKLKLVDGY